MKTSKQALTSDLTHCPCPQQMQDLIATTHDYIAGAIPVPVQIKATVGSSEPGSTAVGRRRLQGTRGRGLLQTTTQAVVSFGYGGISGDPTSTLTFEINTATIPIPVTVQVCQQGIGKMTLV